MIPRPQRLAFVKAYRASGMSMAAFARRERINHTTFAGWMHRAGSVRRSSPIRFAEVKVATRGASTPKAGNELEVTLPDGTTLRAAD